MPSRLTHEPDAGGGRDGRISKDIFFTKLAWAEDDLTAAVRSLKLHALLHRKLVLPSDHIYHQTTERLLRAHPGIIEYDLLNFAFDPKYPTFRDYFADEDREATAGRPLAAYADYLSGLNPRLTTYSARVPARIFTDIAREQFGSPDSALSKAARMAASRF